MTTPKKPPFAKGDWVRGKNADGPPIVSVVRCKPLKVCNGPRRALLKLWREWAQRWLVYTNGGSCFDALELRRASARELRAESARLRKRADELNAAADAVEKAKGKR